MAGVGALLFQAKGTTTAVGLGARALFQTTAQPISSTHTDDGVLQTLAGQGGGLVDAYKAVYTTTTVVPAELLLNDTAYFKPEYELIHSLQPHPVAHDCLYSQTIQVTNFGSEEEIYEIGHVPAGTALTYDTNDIQPAQYPVPLTNISAGIIFSTTSLTLGPGETKSFTAHFSPPSGLDNKTLPVYSGFVTIVSTQSSVKVPYLGAAAVLRDQQVIDNSPDFFGFPIPALLNSTQGVQENLTSYSFNATDYPSVVFRSVPNEPYLDVLALV